MTVAHGCVQRFVIVLVVCSVDTAVVSRGRAAAAAGGGRGGPSHRGDSPPRGHNLQDSTDSTSDVEIPGGAAPRGGPPAGQRGGGVAQLPQQQQRAAPPQQAAGGRGGTVSGSMLANATASDESSSDEDGGEGEDSSAGMPKTGLVCLGHVRACSVRVCGDSDVLCGSC